jgi:hypothetical protein
MKHETIDERMICLGWAAFLRLVFTRLQKA